jgi:hypothetical protein
MAMSLDEMKALGLIMVIIAIIVCLLWMMFE